MADKNLIGLLVRHGETPSNDAVQAIFRGRMDTELEKEGYQQAQEAAAVVAKYPVKRIVASPLKRTMETAKVLNEKLNLPIVQEGALMPFDTGFMTGELKEEFQEIYDFFIDNPDKVIPRGESVNGIHQRIADYFEPALRESEKTFTLFVAHSSTSVCLKNLLDGKFSLCPGDDEVVSPGGVIGIYAVGDGFEMEVLEDNAPQPQHGS